MNHSLSTSRPTVERGIRLAVLIGSLALGGLSALPAAADAQDQFPEIRMTYRDLDLDTAMGRQTLVERVQATSEDHCARYGTLIVPYERRDQPHYCIHAVRSELMRGMPHDVRTAYDLGRRRLPG